VIPYAVATALFLVLMVGPLPVAALAALALVLVTAAAPLPTLSLVVVSLPFYLVPRTVSHFDFSPTEILIVLATVAAGLRIGVGLVAGRASRPGAGPLGSWVRRVAWSSGEPGGKAGPRFSGRPRLEAPAHGWSWRLEGSWHRVSGWVGDPAVAGLALLLGLAAVASLTASVELHQSLQSLRTIIVEPLLFYFLTVTQVRRRRDAYLLALALVLAGVLISLVGFWQYGTDTNIITAEAGLRRIRGFYGSPNNLGLFLGRSLPMAVALAWWLHRGRGWLLGAAAIIGLALLLTFSIGAWLAVALSLLLLAALRGRQTLRAALALGAVGGLVLVVAALRIPRIGSHFTPGNSTSEIRLEVWTSALRLLAGHRLRGIGLDNFLYYYQHGYRLPSAWADPNLSHPHNLVLDFWLSLGLPGPLLLGGLLGRLIENVAGRWRRSDDLARGLYAGSLGAMADTVLHGLVDNSFFLVDLAVLFWLIFAIVTVLQRAEAEEGIQG
jgi:putative inorganic carbon (HCO3(-)) transporter